MGEIYVISDTHFGQWFANWFFDRPFNNIRDMNDKLIDNWNKTVTDKDLVIIVGDFYGGSSIFLRNLIKSLNGEKILVKGNHDFKYRYIKLIRDEEIEVYDRLVININDIKLLFTHIAEDVEDNTINIHGHYHRKLYPDNIVGRHYNVCVEHNEYKPVPLKKILEHDFELDRYISKDIYSTNIFKEKLVWNKGYLLT